MNLEQISMKIEWFNTGIVLCYDVFTDEELHSIESACDDNMRAGGWVETATGDQLTRKSNLVFLERRPDTNLIFQRLLAVAREANERFFHFELTELSEEGILYIDYNQPGDQYDWHVDNSEKYREGKNAVKLIIVLQLTDPSQYEGADAQVACTGIVTIPKKRGLIYVMAGWSAHRVTPLISGRRKVLSCWVSGPTFK
jgi:predicted 2-oxoglutarate/Fe(II)-dependent dioxygenase YbiX